MEERNKLTTNKEYNFLRCKFFTLKENKRGQHRKYLPYVFTEYGMLDY